MQNKITNNIPKLTFREQETKNRFQTYGKCSAMMLKFFDMGFKSFSALKGIVQFHNPSIDVKKLKWVWNMQVITPEIQETLEGILEKLKS